MLDLCASVTQFIVASQRLKLFNHRFVIFYPFLGILFYVFVLSPASSHFAEFNLALVFVEKTSRDFAIEITFVSTFVTTIYCSRIATDRPRVLVGTLSVWPISISRIRRMGS